MKAKDLLEKCEEKIKWFNLWFLWYGFWDELEKIKDEVFEDINDLDGNEVGTFIDICNNRLDRINILLRDLVISISVLALIASILVGTSVQSFECFNFWDQIGNFSQILIILSLFLFPLLFPFLLLLYGNKRRKKENAHDRESAEKVVKVLVAIPVVSEIGVAGLSIILWHQIIILIIPIIFFTFLLFLLIGRYRAQAHAWSAIKEGALLMYAKRRRKRKVRRR